MQKVGRWLLLPGILLLCAFGGEANGQHTAPVTSRESHPVMVTRLYTGADGQSHIDRVPIAFHDASAAVVYLIHDPLKASAAVKTSDACVVQGAPGTVQTWHNADQKRYIVVVSGKAEVTTTDGEKLSLVPGQVYLAEDLTGKGHTFRGDWKPGLGSALRESRAVRGRDSNEVRSQSMVRVEQTESSPISSLRRPGQFQDHF